MAASSRLKTYAIVGVTALALLALLAPVAVRTFDAWAVGIHQQGVTRELAAWEREDSQVHNQQEAFHAVDVLRYVQGYYIPGPGYRSNPQTEAALEAQRHQTMAALVRALEQYTGEHFGLQIEKWEAWREHHQPPATQQAAESRPKP